MHPSVFGADGRSIFSTGNARGRSEEECHLNCTLAAAAPDLLQAAKQAWSWLYDIERAHLKNSAGASVLERLHAAIKKAEEG
jgi:hypothetical protein